ncbi:glycosyltransferase [Saccharicrinis sp. FJH54]|uniref:glycosyltransferase n=1 Tax=Saccharicrinis sp. FJH54 TaxID=3344665 RepID=UPI0035D3ED4C
MKTPLIVLHVLGRLNRGGAETLIMNLYRTIDRSKVQFHFVKHTNEKCAYDDEIISLGGKIHVIERYTGINHFIYVRLWKKLLKTNPEYTIIHGHIRSTASIYLLLAKKFNRITIIHSHATGSRGNLISRSVKNVMQLPIRYISDYFFACSEEAASWLFGKKKVSDTLILKNAINAETFRYDDKIRKKFRRSYGLENKLVLVHVGSFTKPKNHIFLLAIFKEILHKKNDTMLLLVGEGDLKQNLIERISADKLFDSVLFLGSRDDIPNILMGADAFIFPSIFEGFGIAALEAQASGLPTHVSDVLPTEIKATDLLFYHSLKKSAKEWAQEIIDNKIEHRSDRVDSIKELGYDIVVQTNILKEFYLKLTMEY